MRFRKSFDWESLRRRVLRETEEFLARGLRNPDHQTRIPTHPVGRGRFLPEFARAFWNRILGLDDDSQ